MSVIELHLRIRVRPGGRAALFAFLKEAVPYYESPGGITVRMFEDRTDPDRFIEVIAYESEDAYEVDQRRVEHDEEMKSYLARWRSLLAEPPVVGEFGVVPRRSFAGD